MDIRERCPDCKKETTFRRADLEREDETEQPDIQKRRLMEIANGIKRRAAGYSDYSEE